MTNKIDIWAVFFFLMSSLTWNFNESWIWIWISTEMTRENREFVPICFCSTFRFSLRVGCRFVVVPLQFRSSFIIFGSCLFRRHSSRTSKHLKYQVVLVYAYQSDIINLIDEILAGLLYDSLDRQYKMLFDTSEEAQTMKMKMKKMVKEKNQKKKRENKQTN